MTGTITGVIGFLSYSQITSPSHGLTTGTTITISGVGGATGVNGSYAVTVSGSNTFFVSASPGGSYTSGGVWTDNYTPTINRPSVPTPYDFTQTVIQFPDGSFASNAWIEQIGNHSPSTEETAAKFKSASLYAFVPDDPVAYYSFEVGCLGGSYVESDGTLKRVLPIQHPKDPKLRAIRIGGTQGLKFEGRKDGQGPTDAALAKYASYNRRLVRVDFAPPAWNIVTDAGVVVDGVAQEWKRNVSSDPDTKIYIVSRGNTGDFKFAEGVDNDPKGKGFQGEVNFPEVKTDLNLVWKYVPLDYLADTSKLFPFARKVIAAAGKVNSEEFEGYAAGTLLLLEPRVDKYLSGTLRYNNPVTGEAAPPYYMCDVYLPIIHFDPPSFSSTYRGHNLKPWLKGSSFMYHLATSNGSVDGATLYGAYDFKKIFEFWNK